MGQISWRAQRDETVFLGAFEKATYGMSRKVFLKPVYTFATLYDDLYGTRATYNQVKSEHQKGRSQRPLSKRRF